MPILLYGSETGFLSKTDIRSLDFAITLFLMKLFNTTSMDIIATCIEMFNFYLPSTLIEQKNASSCCVIIAVGIHCVVYFLVVHRNFVGPIRCNMPAILPVCFLCIIVFKKNNNCTLPFR